MPTYEYKREDGTTFEIKQSIKDEPLERCPDTGQKVKRVISGGGGVVFKGNGFYETDYKDSDRKEKAKAEKEADKKGAKKTDKKEKPSDASSPKKTKSKSASS